MASSAIVDRSCVASEENSTRRYGAGRQGLLEDRVGHAIVVQSSATDHAVGESSQAIHTDPVAFLALDSSETVHDPRLVRACYVMNDQIHPVQVLMCLYPCRCARRAGTVPRSRELVVPLRGSARTRGRGGPVRPVVYTQRICRVRSSRVPWHHGRGRCRRHEHVKHSYSGIRAVDRSHGDLDTGKCVGANVLSEMRQGRGAVLSEGAVLTLFPRLVSGTANYLREGLYSTIGVVERWAAAADRSSISRAFGTPSSALARYTPLLKGH